MVGRSAETETLRLLYASAVEPAGFAPFLAALADLTRAAGAVLRIEAAAAVEAATGAPVPLPPPEALRRLRRERVYAQEELGLPAPLRLIRVGARTEAQAYLGIGHPRRDFRALDGALLDRLGPHLAQAIETAQALGAERARARAAAAAAAALGAGWLWLDPAGRLVEADATARARLEGLAPPGRLDFADPLLARALRRAIDRALGGAPWVLTLRRRPLLQLALRPGLAVPAPGLEPVLTGFLRQAPEAAALDPAALAASLDLNRSETRLAVLLCDGLTLAEAAAHLGWTQETARSASKRIFARTGTRGQSDLIRRLLAGADWLASG